MSNRLVSIIIPYYKKKNFFYRSFQSAYNQSYKNVEIIIIYDDTSLKDLNFIKKIINKKKNIKLLINKKIHGAGGARNLGIKHSKGRYLAFLDSDDIWYRDKLKKQINFMSKNKINLSFTSYKIIDEKNRFIQKRLSANKICYDDLIKSCDIGLSTVVINKNHFRKKIFFPNIKTKEDYVLWLKLSKSGECFFGLKDNLALWRKTQNSLSSDILQKLKDGFTVYNKYLKYNFFKSLLFVFVLSYNYLKKS